MRRQEVIVADKDRHLYLKKIFNDYILCGEGGLAPKGFDYDNDSPLEISRQC